MKIAMSSWLVKLKLLGPFPLLAKNLDSMGILAMMIMSAIQRHSVGTNKALMYSLVNHVVLISIHKIQGPLLAGYHFMALNSMILSTMVSTARQAGQKMSILVIQPNAFPSLK